MLLLSFLLSLFFFALCFLFFSRTTRILFCHASLCVCACLCLLRADVCTATATHSTTLVSIWDSILSDRHKTAPCAYLGRVASPKATPWLHHCESTLTNRRRCAPPTSLAERCKWVAIYCLWSQLGASSRHMIWELNHTTHALSTCSCGSRFAEHA